MNDARLGDFLVKLGVITPQQLHTTREAQASGGGRLAKHLVAKNFVTEAELARLAATALRLPYVALDRVVVPKNLVKLLSKEMAVKVKGIVVKNEGKRFYLATCDPVNLQAIDEVQFQLGGSVSTVVAAETEVIRSLNHYYNERIMVDRPFDLPLTDTLDFDKPEVFDIKAARKRRAKAAAKRKAAAPKTDAGHQELQDRLSRAAADVEQARPAAQPSPAAAEEAPVELDAPVDLEAPLELEAQPEAVVEGVAEADDVVVAGEVVDDEVVELEVLDDESTEDTADAPMGDDLLALFGKVAFGADTDAASGGQASAEADELARLFMGAMDGASSAKAASEPPPADDLAKDLASLLLDNTDFKV